MACSVAGTRVRSGNGKGRRSTLAVAVTLALIAVPAAGVAVPARAAIAGPAGSAHERVIVVLRSQPAATRPGTAASAARSAAIAARQAPLIRQLRRSGATSEPFWVTCSPSR